MLWLFCSKSLGCKQPLAGYGQLNNGFMTVAVRIHCQEVNGGVGMWWREDADKVTTADREHSTAQRDGLRRKG